LIFSPSALAIARYSFQVISGDDFLILRLQWNP